MTNASTAFLSLKSLAYLLRTSEMFLAESAKERSDEAVMALLISESFSASLKLAEVLKMARALAS